MAQSEWVVEATEANFQEEVVERSRTVPVVVDFWAPWCGPCRSLGPMLERLADESAGGFVLAKVNTDENPNLAGEFGVSGIPAVFAVRDAAVVDQFVGLLPEDQLRQFIAGLTPSEADALVSKAREQETTDAAAAEAGYRAALAAEPGSERVRVGLARVLLAGRGREAEAAELLRGIEAGEHAPEADRLRRVLKFREVAHGDAELAAARTVGPFEVGQVLAARGEYVSALDALIAAAEADKKLAAGPVRELMVDIFHVIGVRSPEADAYRDRLRALLY